MFCRKGNQFLSIPILFSEETRGLANILLNSSFSDDMDRPDGFLYAGTSQAHRL